MAIFLLVQPLDPQELFGQMNRPMMFVSYSSRQVSESSKGWKVREVIGKVEDESWVRTSA